MVVWGAVSEAIEIARQALVIAESQLLVWRAYILGTLAHLHLLQGKTADAQAAIQRGKRDPYREAYIVYFVPVLLAEAELALKNKDFPQALAVTEPLIIEMKKYGMRLHLPDVLYLQGQAFVGLGNEETARQQLEEARLAAEAMNAKRPLWPILLALSRLEKDPKTAETLAKKANQIFTSIVNHIPDKRQAILFQERFPLIR